MKYFSKKIRNDHGEFDSKAEYERYLHLKHLEDIGVISCLKRQVKFEIIPMTPKKVKIELKTKTKEVERVDERAKYYTADFTYLNSNGQYVISEVKSTGTILARDYPLYQFSTQDVVSKVFRVTAFEFFDDVFPVMV